MEQEHICEVCRRSYSQSQGLARHIRSKIQQESQMPDELQHHRRLRVRRQGRQPRQHQTNGQRGIENIQPTQQEETSSTQDIDDEEEARNQTTD